MKDEIVFEQKQARFTKFQKAFRSIFFSVLLIFSCIFVLSQFYDASQKAFWVDEHFGLKSVRSQGFDSLLLKGMPGQGSPSPLDYMVVKVFDGIKTNVNYFSLAPRVYYRLVPQLVTLLCFWVVMIIFSSHLFKSRVSFYLETISLFILLCVGFSFLFSEHIYLYATELRPYALWNALWFLCLSIFLFPEKQKTQIGVLVLLSLTATAFVFQLFSLGIVLTGVLFLEKRRIKEVFKIDLKLFLIPTMIVLFYCLIAQKIKWGWGGDEWGTWPEFLIFWRGEFERFHILIPALVLCLIKKETRRFAVVPLAMFILFALGPLIYYLTRLQGFFFTMRQYLYYHLTGSIALLVLIRCLPFYVLRINNKKILIFVMVIICGLSAGVTFRSKTVKQFKKSFYNTSLIISEGIPYVEDEHIKD